ncbi:DUF1828 domain-containing protein [Limosilactobacillus fermentum]|uniref:DUF1828 domain-containing protein n=1 Tax=Limosilactobacillus fermentum TaxID=1613 RepID=UPI000F601931|nr:DUF1828 domain-containing protein [Limosilactobacillus fermentum]AZI17764.1 DUF1828 domain-containing protein [Limosilactobacillus fermentum]MDQ2153676.1 DUF1828 domain-containing protein [Limosilactobacillus fermentum]
MQLTSSVLENSYYAWLKRELVFSEVGNGYVPISTPFIDNNYDNINLYARFVTKNEIELSDFGYTKYNLSEAGITLDRRHRTIWRIYEQIQTDFGISERGDALTITAPLDKFANAKMRLLQAIMRINDIVFLRKENVTESFNDMVADFLKGQNILYTPSFEIATTVGVTSHFDFAVPNESGPERIVRTVSRPNDINAAKIFNYDVKATATIREALFVFLVNDLTYKAAVNRSTFDTALKDLDQDTAIGLSFADVKQDNQWLVNR